MDAGLCEANDSPLEADVWSIAAAAISGAQYAVKIRLPHAFVMVFMFRRDLSLQAKLTLCAKAVVEHATSLGGFAALYKAVLVALKLWDRRKLSPSTSSLLYELGRLFVNLFGKTLQKHACIASYSLPSSMTIDIYASSPHKHFSSSLFHHSASATSVSMYTFRRHHVHRYCFATRATRATLPRPHCWSCRWILDLGSLVNPQSPSLDVCINSRLGRTLEITAGARRRKLASHASSGRHRRMGGRLVRLGNPSGCLARFLAKEHGRNL